MMSQSSSLLEPENLWDLKDLVRFKKVVETKTQRETSNNLGLKWPPFHWAHFLSFETGSKENGTSPD